MDAVAERLNPLIVSPRLKTLPLVAPLSSPVAEKLGPPQPPSLEQLDGLMITILNSDLLIDSQRNKRAMDQILAGLDQVLPEQLPKYGNLYGRARLVYRFGQAFDYPHSDRPLTPRHMCGPTEERDFFVNVALKLRNKECLLDAVDEVVLDLKDNKTAIQRRENPRITAMLFRIVERAEDPEVKAKATQALGEFIFTAKADDLPLAKNVMQQLENQLKAQKDELSASRLLEVLSKGINQERSPLLYDMELLRRTFGTVSEIARATPTLTRQSTDLLFHLIRIRAASAGAATPVMGEMIGQIVPFIKSLPVESRRAFAFQFKAIPVEGMGGGSAQGENIRQLLSTAATDIEASIPFEKGSKGAIGIGDGFEKYPPA